MTTPLRVLIVDDSEDDAELLLARLRRGGYAPIAERVDSAAALCGALDRDAWDVVISDYTMPHFSGPAALALLKGRASEVPLIMVSRKVGEDVAVEVMRAGARDYILKGNLARLVPAIQRELDDAAKRRQAEETLQRQMALEKLLMRISTSFIGLPADEVDSGIDHALRAIGQMLGMDRSYVWLLSADGLTVDAVYEWCADGAEERVLGVRGAPFDTWPWHAAGIRRLDVVSIPNVAELPPEASAEKAALEALSLRSAICLPMVDEGTVIGCLGLGSRRENTWSQEVITLLSIAGQVFGNVILRRQMEERLRESERQYRELAGLLPQPIFETDEIGQTVFVNQAAFDYFGYGQEALDQRLDISLGTAPPDRARAEESLRRVFLGGTMKGEEFLAARKDGSTFPVMVYASPIVRQERIVGMRGIVVDITERKRDEEKLRQSERRYRELADLLPQPIFECDLEGRVTFVNRSTSYYFGFRQADVDAGLQIVRAIVPQDRHRVEEDLQRVLRGEDVQPREYESLRQDGRTFPIMVYAARIVQDGKVVGLRGVAIDMTERRRAEEEHNRSLYRLQRALEETIGAIAATTELRDLYTAGHQRRVAELACAIATEMGLSAEQIHVLHLAAIVHDVGKISVPAEILSKPGRLSELEFSIIKGHCDVGHDILQRIDFPWPIARIVRQHHERMDGSGYPAGLRGEEIALEARILAVADVVDAMVSHRPYRPALGIDAALQEIDLKSGTLYDPDMARTCRELFSTKGFAWTDRDGR